MKILYVWMGKDFCPVYMVLVTFLKNNFWEKSEKEKDLVFSSKGGLCH